MLDIGLNPYGVAYTVGLQGAGTTRANPKPSGLEGFLALARDMGATCFELDWRWLTPMTPRELETLRTRLADVTPICSFWLSQQPDETLSDAIRCATAIAAPIVRLHLTPVLEGARGCQGERWPAMLSHARSVLAHAAPGAAEAGLILAVENHQDLCSSELVEMTGEAGDNVGIVLDTGNPFAVGEDPVAFTRRAADRIRHVHLKDYVAQFTDDGFRLVRCAIGDGCVPLAEMAAVLGTRHPRLTASLECGALEARHVRLFDPDWWAGYVPRDARELAAALRRLRQRRLPEAADYRTPWERHEEPAAIVAYEMAQLRRSIENMRAAGWLPGPRPT